MEGLNLLLTVPFSNLRLSNHIKFCMEESYKKKKKNLQRRKNILKIFFLTKKIKKI